MMVEPDSQRIMKLSYVRVDGRSAPTRLRRVLHWLRSSGHRRCLLAGSLPSLLFTVLFKAGLISGQQLMTR